MDFRTNWQQAAVRSSKLTLVIAGALLGAAMGCAEQDSSDGAPTDDALGPERETDREANSANGDAWDDRKWEEAPGADRLLPKESTPAAGALSSTSQALISYSGCTAGEQGHLGIDVIPHAHRIAVAARDYANTSPAVWFGYWFGDPASPLARTNLRRIATMLNRSSATGTTVLCDPKGPDATPSCTSNGGFLARFQGTDTIRICEAFWGLSYEDKVYTILHEAAHRFTPDNNDEDCSLGGGNNSAETCFYLARLDPTEAAEQVMEYEYYYRGWF